MPVAWHPKRWWNFILILLAKDVTWLKSSPKKSISSLVGKASWNFSSILFVTNQSGINSNAPRQSSTFFEFYIYQSYIYHKRIFVNNSVIHFLNFIPIVNRIKYKKSYISSSITYFLSLVAFRNKLYFRRITIDSLIMHFLSLLTIRDKFWCMQVIINSFLSHLLIFVAVTNRL